MKTNNPKKEGRPTLYSASTVGKVDDYLIRCKDLIKNRIVQVNLPKIEGLAKYLNVNKDTLYEWGKKYPEFSDALERVKNEQCSRLIDSGLSGAYNSTIAKLMLTTNHGFNDAVKNEVEKVNQEPTEEEKELIRSIFERNVGNQP